LALIHDVEVARSEKQVMSVLFLDVKGAFDNVSKSRLLGTLHDLGLPSAILQWVKYFMSDRLVALAFDGQREDLAPVETGIPQGSPTSPILFLLYISPLFKELKRQYPSLSTPSYIDDIALATSGRKELNNAKELTKAARKAFQ